MYRLMNQSREYCAQDRLRCASRAVVHFAVTQSHACKQRVNEYARARTHTIAHHTGHTHAHITDLLHSRCANSVHLRCARAGTDMCRSWSANQQCPREQSGNLSTSAYLIHGLDAAHLCNAEEEEGASFGVRRVLHARLLNHSLGLLCCFQSDANLVGRDLQSSWHESADHISKAGV